jgi:hypothetical protein
LAVRPRGQSGTALLTAAENTVVTMHYFCFMPSLEAHKRRILNSKIMKLISFCSGINFRVERCGVLMRKPDPVDGVFGLNHIIAR